MYIIHLGLLCRQEATNSLVAPLTQHSRDRHMNTHAGVRVHPSPYYYTPSDLGDCNTESGVKIHVRPENISALYFSDTSYI